MSTSDNFTPIGPDWYNVYKKEDNTVAVKPCAGVMSFKREETDNGRLFIRSYSGFVQFTASGRWNLASEFNGYVGTFHIPDFHVTEDEIIRERFVDNISHFGWVV
jgi:hypothetical protein